MTPDALPATVPANPPTPAPAVRVGIAGHDISRYVVPPAQITLTALGLAAWAYRCPACRARDVPRSRPE